MKSKRTLITAVAWSGWFVLAGYAQEQRIEVSDDGRGVVVVCASATEGTVIIRGRGVPYGTTPDWQNDLRRQVGGLQAEDMNGDELIDVVVGCYHSDSYPPDDDWENYIYYNAGGFLEASPSWVSTDEVSTGDVQVANINGDTYPDIFAANGGYSKNWSSDKNPRL